MDSNKLAIIILVAIVALAVILISLAIHSIKKSIKKNKELRDQGIIIRGDKGEGNYENISFTYLHFRGGKNAPPYFEITIQCPSSGSFKITRESNFDRFFKRLGVCVEIETGDLEFDKMFYIDSSTVEFARQLLSDPKKRNAVRMIFDDGFNELTLSGNLLKSRWNGFPRDNNLEMEKVQQIASFLNIISNDVPVIYEPERIENSGWKTKRIIAFAIPITLIITGIISLIAGLSTFLPLDAGTVILNSFKYSIPFLFLFFFLAFKLLKGRSSSHIELIIVTALALGGFIIAGMGYELTLNGWLDNKEATTHNTIVLDKYYTKSKNNYSYYANVQSWRQGRKSEKLKVRRDYYDQLVPGVSRMTVTTKPGKFDFEWIVDYE